MSASFYELPGRILCVCPKAGSQSIRRTMGATKELQLHDIQNTAHRQGKTVTLFLRHPVRRLQSAYRYFYGDWPRDTGFTETPYMPYEAFVDAVLDGASNRHWDGQSHMVTYGNTFVPTEVYRFEDINTLWHRVCDKPLQWRNASQPRMVNEDYRLSDLDNFYAEDLERWNLAKPNWRSIK